MREVICWEEESPGALIRCSMHHNAAELCKKRAQWGIVTELRGEPGNYRLWAFCSEHMQLWTSSNERRAAMREDSGKWEERDTHYAMHVGEVSSDLWAVKDAHGKSVAYFHTEDNARRFAYILIHGPKLLDILKNLPEHLAWE